MKRIALISTLFLLLLGCGKAVKKEFFMINYAPDPVLKRAQEEPYPFTLRVKRFTIEKVYGKPNIVYRASPFKLEYYGFRHWAVRPADMLTDLIFSHLDEINLVEILVRRLDDAASPDYELTAHVEAIEEYDSDELWFAHLAIRYQIKRLSDESIIYTRRFDKRKQVENHTPADVVKTLSEIMDHTSTDLMNDIDNLLSKELANMNSKKSESN